MRNLWCTFADLGSVLVTIIWLNAFESSEIMSSLDITANRYMQTGHTGHTDTQEHTHTYNIHNIHHSSPIFNQLSPYLFHKFQSQITFEIWISKVSDNNHLKYIRKKSEEKPKEKKKRVTQFQCNATQPKCVKCWMTGCAWEDAYEMDGGGGKSSVTETLLPTNKWHHY